MLYLIILEALTYAINLSIRKNFIMPYVSNTAYIIITTIITTFIGSIATIIYPGEAKKYFNEVTDIKMLSKVGPLFLLASALSYSVLFLWLRLLRENNLSKLVTINNVFISLFTGIIGVLFFKETYTPINVAGIIIGLFGIYLMNL